VLTGTELQGCAVAVNDMDIITKQRVSKKIWHPLKLLYTFLEHFPFAGAFSQKTVNYFWAHMKDAKNFKFYWR